MSVLSFSLALLRRGPPWLQRTVGGAVMRAFGDPLDTLRDLTADAVDARFPRATRPDALPPIGRDRKIVRGLNEPASTYAARLRRWWTDHQTRGNPHAMLRQLEAFFATDPVQIEIVYNSGTRYTLAKPVAPATRGVISRDAISWGGNGIPAKWAEAWAFIRYDLNAEFPLITTELAQGVVTICDDWNAAHMLRIHPMVVAENACELWDYPAGEIWDDGSGELWDPLHCYQLDGYVGPTFVTVGGLYLTVGGKYVTVN
jgi:hypothetical protein